MINQPSELPNKPAPDFARGWSRFLVSTLTMAIMLLATGHVHAQYVWNGLGGDFDWTNGKNWVDGVPPDNYSNAVLIFGSSPFPASPSIADDVEGSYPWYLNRIEIPDPNTSYTISGNTLIFSSAGPFVDAASAVSSISAAVAVPGMISYPDPEIISSSPQDQTIENVILVEGDLTVRNLGAGDLRFLDGGFDVLYGSLTIGPGVTVDTTLAGSAVRAFGNGTTITNQGVVRGKEFGVESRTFSAARMVTDGAFVVDGDGSAGTRVINLPGGEITGDTGIGFANEMTDGGVIFDGGLIDVAADILPIAGPSPSPVIITNEVSNQGTISGIQGVAIISTGSASDSVSNWSGGAIVGDILLGAGDDSLTLETGSTFNDLANGGPDIDVLTLTGNGSQTAVLNHFANFEHLAKEGAGQWTVVGTGAFPHGTTVDQGTLYVDGNLVSDVHVGPQAVLAGGSGKVTGSVHSYGSVSPGPLNSPDTFTITGNYTQASGGALHIDVGGLSPGSSDLLAVKGTAELGGKLSLIQLNNFRLKRSDKLAILTAEGGVIGTFDDVEGLEQFGVPGSILDPVIVYSDQEVILTTMAVGTFEDCAQTPNQKAVGRVIDGITGDPRAADLIDFLDSLLKSDLPTAFDLIAPEELSSLFSASFASSNLLAANLQQQFEAIRNGSSGFNGNNVSIAIYGKGPSDGTDLAVGKETKEVIPPPVEDRRWGVFLNGFGEFVFVDGNFQADSYDITNAGFTLGADYRVSDNFAIGIYGGYTHSNADLTGNGNVEINGGKGGIYATAFGSGAYLNLAIGGGYNSYDTRRQGLGGQPVGNTDGGEFDSLIGLGYDWNLGGFSVGPTANLQYTYVGIDGYTETGSLAPLKIADQSADSLRSRIGARASYDGNVSGVRLVPEIRAAWQHEYLDDTYSVAGRLASGAGSGFTVDGPYIGADSLILGAGLTVYCSERLAVYVNYDAQLASENYSYHSVTGGFRFNF